MESAKKRREESLTVTRIGLATVSGTFLVKANAGDSQAFFPSFLCTLHLQLDQSKCQRILRNLFSTAPCEVSDHVLLTFISIEEGQGSLKLTEGLGHITLPHECLAQNRSGLTHTSTAIQLWFCTQLLQDNCGNFLSLLGIQTFTNERRTSFVRCVCRIREAQETLCQFYERLPFHIGSPLHYKSVRLNNLIAVTSLYTTDA